MNLQKLSTIGATVASLLASSFLTGCATSKTATTTGGADGKLPKKADLLFVQNAQGVSLSKGRLTLREVNPTTVAFADRPVRFAGHMQTKQIVPMWSQGKDSFLKDPPNATLSVFSGKKVSNAVVTLHNPRLQGSDLIYDVNVLEGGVPKASGACSLFIDIIGMPLTPFSYAGAARRAVRWGAYDRPVYVPPAYVAPVYGGPTVVHYGPYGTTVVRRW